MFHNIEFRSAITLDVEVAPGQPLEKVQVQSGTRASAQVKPYVVNTRRGPIEVANLCFEDGPTARSVPFAFFRFID